MEDRHLLETIFGSFNPLRLHMKLGGDESDYTADGSSIETLATWVHERTHFHQTIFTAFGQICWDSQRQMTGYLVNEWREMPLLSNGKRGLPLAHAANGFIPAQVKGILARDTCYESIMLFRARHSLPHPERLFSELKLKLINKPWMINPTVSVGGENYSLEGNDILEGQALFVEASFLEAQGRKREEIWDHLSLKKCYWLARDWFLEQIGEERYSDFPFVCDLALQTSRRPDIPTTQEEWEASSPSWRFFKLTQALKGETGLTVGPFQDWPLNYDKFAQTLLCQCNFKSLNEVFEERREALHRRPEMMKLEQLLERAIDYRLNVPWCAGNPIVSSSLWQELLKTLPAPLVQVEGKIGTHAVSDQDLNNEIVMELQFQALASQILGEFSDYAKFNRAVECAFNKFGIPKGCEFQKTHGCVGCYRPEDGPPHAPVESNGVLAGCTFEALLISSGNPSDKIEVNADATFPSLAEIEQRLSREYPR